MPSSTSPDHLRKWFERVDDRFMGSPLNIDPTDAILWAMRVTAGEVAYCDAQIARLEEDELFERPRKTMFAELPSGQWDIVEERRDAEVMNRWVQWRDHAMSRMAQYAKMALDVGIEERQIQIAEKHAQQIVTVITAVLTDLGLDPTDISTRQIVRRRLVESASIEGSAVSIS